MNELSQLIYWADVTGSADGLFAFLAVVFGFGSVCSTICYFGFKSDGVDPPKIALLGPPIAFLTFCMAAVFTPSKDTIYAIAASQMGEKAIATPTAQKAFKALNAWLDRQIDGEPSKSDEDERK